jgi:hypothetical protein
VEKEDLNASDNSVWRRLFFELAVFETFCLSTSSFDFKASQFFRFVPCAIPSFCKHSKTIHGAVVLCSEVKSVPKMGGFVLLWLTSLSLLCKSPLGIEINKEILVSGTVVCQDRPEQFGERESRARAVLFSSTNHFSQTRHSITPFIFYIPADQRYDHFLVLILSETSVILYSKSLSIGGSISLVLSHIL